MRELEIYVHIPFCVKKCAYCDFLSAPASEEERAGYVRDLTGEIKSGLPVSARSLPEPEDAVVTSVFIGGGTPSILAPGQIRRIMEALRGRFRFSQDADAVEVTLECNPGTLSKANLESCRACGINRLSIGLQSADNEELKTLGRIHTWEDFLTSYEMARAAGFKNINIDLMSGLPGGSADSFERTLRQVLKLKPEHLSVYSLIIEKGTPFYERYHEDDRKRKEGEEPAILPSEEEEGRTDNRTEELLFEEGFIRYEISNYARPGYECRHNIGYWQRKEYLGFGLGASSFLRVPSKEGDSSRAMRLKNPSNPAGYARALAAKERADGAECEVLTTKDEMAEFMFLGLRMTKGVSGQAFSAQFGRTIDEIYGDVIARLCALGLLIRKDDRIFLSARGRDLGNPVMAEFLL